MTTEHYNSVPETTDESVHQENHPEQYNYEYEYDEYIYQGFSFEAPVYLYIWEILVLVTSLVNIVVVFVLLQRQMRNSTNMILVAIAISDSLTGLVTLPTYIMVFQRFDPPHETVNDGNSSGNMTEELHTHLAIHHSNFPPTGCRDDHQYYNEDGFVYHETNGLSRNNCNTTPYYNPNLAHFHDPVNGYLLTKELCRGFMISKFFLSQSFHTVSIFLTLFLGIQRFVSVTFPFKAPSFFSVPKTLVCCTTIFILSPILHVFHLNDEKAKNGHCHWALGAKGCQSGCIYLWMMFFIRHFIPCIMLIIFTALFVSELNKGQRNLCKSDSMGSQMSRRNEENRRITVTVIAIVIVFLIPEVPYGSFFLYSAIEQSVHDGKNMDLETNRVFHMVYELLLVASFHANFYIYTVFNKRFRKTLKRSFVDPLRRLMGAHKTLSLATSTSQRSTRKTELSTSKSGHELKQLNGNGSSGANNVNSKTMEEKTSQQNSDAVTIETKFMESCSPEITQNQESSEHDKLIVTV